MLKKNINKFSFILFFLLFPVVGCADGGLPILAIDNASERPPREEALAVLPPICSALDFRDVSWPADFRDNDQVAFALAMNITGSFEGHAGWTNLSNNFDKQGMSMGILNQNLGQGSLQPLLIRMRDENNRVLENVFSAEMLDSIYKMLTSWERSQPLVSPRMVEDHSLVEREWADFFIDGFEKKYYIHQIQTRSNSSSVRWAVNNLYTDSKGRNFKPEWKTALKALAGHPVYVSLQIEAARYIHDRTHIYRERLAWNQLRSYLFLFDIVVQNGSLAEKHFNKFENWLDQKPQASEEEQMLKMLDIRVVDSHPKWQKDVRLRKTAVITGQGHVHGEHRDLPVEYCYEPILAYQKQWPLGETMVAGQVRAGTNINSERFAVAID